MANTTIANLDEDHMAMAFPRELTVGTYHIFAAAIVVLLLCGVTPVVETDYVENKLLIIYPAYKPEPNYDALYDYLGG